MKPRKYSLVNLFKKLFGAPAPRPVLTPLVPAAPGRRERVRHAIEPLEGRIAPATLLSPRVLTYIDPEGDRITVTFSADVFLPDSPTLGSDLQKVFVFDHGSAHTGAANATDDVPQQLQLINLTQAPRSGTGADSVNRTSGISMTITADKQVVNALEIGDGLAAIGAIRSGGNVLGNIVIEGDLGQIDCGLSSAKIGLKSLQVGSIGKFGTDTQIQGTTPAPELESRIVGRVKSISVTGDMGGFINVVDANTGTALIQKGTIDSLSIGGSLRGNPAVAASSDNTGRIDCSSDILVATLGRIDGGGGKSSGTLNAVHSLGDVTVTGKVLGGAGQDSGAIRSNGSITSLKLNGGLEGGTGLRSGDVRALGSIGTVTLGSAGTSAHLTGSDGEESGRIVVGKKIDHLNIFGNVVGGVGNHSGSVVASSKLAEVVVTGSLQGANGLGSGAIESLKNIGTFTSGGSLLGGNGVASGSVISGGSLGTVTVEGNLDGGTGPNSGSIFVGHDPSLAQRDLRTVVVKGALLGDQGISSGSILAGGAIGSVDLGQTLPTGSVAMNGGNGALSGAIFAGGAVETITVGGSVVGQGGSGSASIQAHGKISRVEVKGNVVGGFGRESASILAHELVNVARPVAGDIGRIIIAGQLKGSDLGTGDRAALIEAEGTLRVAEIGSMIGSNGEYSAAIVSGSGLLKSGTTTSITVGGVVEGGNGAHSGSIRVEGPLGSLSAGALSLAEIRVGADLGSLVVLGNVSDSLITARGQRTPETTRDVAIGSITISGSVSSTQILAGFNQFGFEANADAQIGEVRVDGSWTASTLGAGVAAGADGLFGTADDRAIDGKDRAAIIGKIASVIIGGTVQGTASSGDHFGFVAERIGSFEVGGMALALSSAGGETFPLGTFDDVTVREIIPA